jgi:hypothetical protein
MTYKWAKFYTSTASIERPITLVRFFANYSKILAVSLNPFTVLFINAADGAINKGISGSSSDQVSIMNSLIIDSAG